MGGQSRVQAWRAASAWAACALVAACGGGGGEGTGASASSNSPAAATPAPSPAPAAPVSPGAGSSPTSPAPVPSVTPPPPPPPPPPAARIANLELAQSLLYRSADPSLLLVANKAVLVKVNATTTQPNEAIPAGTLRVETPAGDLIQALPLTPPTSAVPATVPTVPSLTDAYTAVVPANLVKSGLRLTAVLENGQPGTTINPRVGSAVDITVVAVPIQIGSLVGQVVPGAKQYLEARMPVSSVTVQSHTPYVARSVTTLPNDSWASAYSAVWAELNDLYMLESSFGSRTYYYGFMPKRINAGTVGVSHTPGFAALGFDLPSNPAAVLRTMAHELGHNLNLLHAPCGAPQDPDPQYPYPDALLGGPGRPYVWGYLADTGSFVDPRVTNRHDLMGYCDGDTFSDYSYHVMQAYLSPTDFSGVMAFKANRPQELILISGQMAEGRVSLTPVKAMFGLARGPQGSEYTLQIVTSQGAVVSYPFDMREVEHGAGAQYFGFTIPNPGDISSISVIKGGVPLMSVPAPVASSSLASKMTPKVVPDVQVAETAGVLNLRWDASMYRYLTVTHQGATQRMTLAQDLEGGSASLSVAALPEGGTLEFSLSDGVNAVRVTRSR